jgi:GNAT superfamily N-acetyltransferase
MTDSILIRLATPVDAPVLGKHRTAMFRDMGTIHPSSEAALLDASTGYFESALASGEYVGWVGYQQEDAARIVAGAGLQLRGLLPRPEPKGNGLLLGREGLILNVYVEPAWRRRGLARRLMQEILIWAAGAGVARLVLHASNEGRPLYESLGFIASNEMRHAGAPAAIGPATGAV